MPNQVNAAEWNDAICLFKNNEKSQLCKATKGEAIFKGKQGYLHTFTFPNGKKYSWFYSEQSVLCT
ncbi:hypothetical protein LC593_16460 [Nostoc sp. CHAB 5844]|nr:hypothetical protein [Nostoc sp. CHAB 5844]